MKTTIKSGGYLLPAVPVLEHVKWSFFRISKIIFVEPTLRKLVKNKLTIIIEVSFSP